ncbi:hypothetical protein [Paenibacillus sp. NPDC058071]|uniref:hypothetical protein n=1 Tax=Paenibacillus sp. NPDC058071 TaxID=3346326 RepID=UPI0036DDC94C
MNNQDFRKQSTDQSRRGNRIPKNNVKREDVDTGHIDSNPLVKKKNLHRFVIGLVALGAVAGFIITSGSSGSRVKIDAVKANGGVGLGVSAGTILATTDDAGMAARDFNIEMKQGTGDGRALVWDYAAEDGDVVTIKVNGAVVAENVQIYHKPVSVNISVPSVVEVIGVKDGGGGITYGIKFPGAVGNSAYFNAAPEGSANTYTIK